MTGRLAPCWRIYNDNSIEFGLGIPGQVGLDLSRSTGRLAALSTEASEIVSEASRHATTRERYNMSMKTILYGIKNCDTMKKARAWLDSNGVSYEFHDYKVSGVNRETLERWAKVVGWETLLNRAGTTFRKLPEQQKVNLTQDKAIELMLEQPSMIKRPVLERGKTLLVGFSPEKYAALK